MLCYETGGGNLYRESSFESNVKWFVLGSGGIAALCQVIMLFAEFKIFSGIGILFNGIYHFLAIGCPVLIIYLILKMVDNKEVYSYYALALQSIFACIVDICLIIKYVTSTNKTEGFKIWLLVLAIVLVLLEGLVSFVFIRHALDKVTCMVPLLLSFITCIIKGAVFSSVDSNIITYNHAASNGSFFSIWMFMHIMFYLTFLVCLALYLDSDFFSELISDPKNLFTSKTFFGTYTNLYFSDEKTKKKESAEQIILSHNSQVTHNMQCQDAGQQIILSDHQNTSAISNTVNQQDSDIKRKCPDCGNILVGNVEMCNKCGCPIDINDRELIIEEEKIVIGTCPDCGEQIYVGQTMCNKCGCPL